jgi:hypothetical protein
VCTEPVDMRYGFDRLAQVARERVGRNRTAEDVGSGRARAPAMREQVVDLRGGVILDA